MNAVAGSGMMSMSLALMACQPRMLDPSKPMPSSKVDALNSCSGYDACCHWPRKSTNFRSTILTSLSLANLMTCSGVLCVCTFQFLQDPGAPATGPVVLDRLFSALAGADSDGLDDGDHEDLAVAD